MVDIATLGLVVRSDGVVVAGKRLRDFQKDARDTDKTVSALGNTFNKLGATIGAVAGAFVTKALIDMTSAWSDLKGRVDLAAGSMEAGNEVMARLETMARRTYSSLGNTADSYLSNANALKDLGLTTSEALDFTEALNNAMVVSGAKAQQAASVQNALSKAMGLGKLAGEDLNTILSSGGRIAQLLAQELDTTTLGLRKLGAEGKITSDVIQRALIGNLGKLREEADSMAATMQDGMMLIGNSIFAMVGRIDQAIGAGENFATMFVGIADAITGATGPAIEGITVLIENFPRLVAIGLTFAAFWGGPYVAAMIAANLSTLTLAGSLIALRGALIGSGVGIIILVIGELVYQLYKAAESTGSFSNALNAVWNIGKTVFERLMLGIEALSVTFTAVALNIQAAFVGSFAVIYRTYAELVNLMRAGLQALGVEMGPALDPEWGQKMYENLSTQASLAGEEAALRWQTAFNGKKQGGPADEAGAFPSEQSFAETFFPTDKPNIGVDTDKKKGSSKLDEYQRLTKAIAEQTQELAWQKETLMMTDFQADKYNKTMELMRAAMEAGKPMTAELKSEIDNLALGYATAAEELRGMQRDMQFMDQMNSAIASGFADVFTSIIDGSKTAGEAIGDLLKNLGKLLINQAFNNLFNVGGGGGGLLGNLLGGFFKPPTFDGGGSTGSGPRSGGVDGKGGFAAILHPNETVIDHTKPSNDNGSSGGGLHIQINGSNLTQAQMTQAIADAISAHDSELARKVENKVRGMQVDPRAADGSW